MNVKKRTRMKENKTRKKNTKSLFCIVKLYNNDEERKIDIRYVISAVGSWPTWYCCLNLGQVVSRFSGVSNDVQKENILYVSVFSELVKRFFTCQQFNAHFYIENVLNKTTPTNKISTIRNFYFAVLVNTPEINIIISWKRFIN